jgi:hypothetical protein
MTENNILPDNVINYLKKFAYTNWRLEKESDKLYDNIVVVPSLAEFERIYNCINSLERNNEKILKRTLVIIVINNSDKSETEIVDNNRKTFQLLSNYSGKLDINFIDAFSEGNALKKKLAGVGFARKIGLDLALTKFDYSTSEKKILFWLDADCEVEQNYLEVVTDTFKHRNLNSSVIEYEHKINDQDAEARAMVCYETFLRYFKLGLVYAKSHYDYHAIGSTIVCDVDSYIKAGGMNTKQAGEDFYFLEKLAKQNKVETIKETIVYPSSRKSWRVPFGTGQRITRYLKNIQDEYLVYNPMSFELLKNWLEFFSSDSTIDSDKIIVEAKKINVHLYNFLVEQKFEKSWNKILNNSESIDEIRKQKIFWFDAFRTLKLIHFLRQKLYNDINVYEALKFFSTKIDLNFDLNIEKAKKDYQLQKQILISLRNYFRKKYDNKSQSRRNSELLE